MKSPEAQEFLLRISRAILLSTRSPDFVPRYNEAVSRLAPFNPMLAYRLAGRERILNIDDALQTYIATVMPSVSDPPAQAVIDRTTTKMIEELYSTVLTELAESATEVAAQLWTVTAWKAQQSLKRQDEPLDFEEMSAFLDRTIPPDVANLSTARPSGPTPSPT